MLQNSGVIFLITVLGSSAASRAAEGGVGQDPNATPGLRWSTYVTAGSVVQLAEDSGELEIAIRRMRDLGITRAFLEVYRGRLVEREALIHVRDALRDAGFEVAGGIATVPGPDYGVRQEALLGWFNWQNPKTQEDMRRVAEMAAGIFDTVIIDDFFCTGDLSEESDRAREGRLWPDYRRDLMVKVASSVFLGPARQVKPDITMIVKYPQWYDKFHEFGYDVERESALFDKVWVGTETRGAHTQRYGFVQPYEGFVNYRWIASIAGDKTSGAWFDHGDCDGPDFIDQAYQSVLAGAPEIVLFSYAAIRSGHPGHELLKQEQVRLSELAAAVQSSPVKGVPAYKPPNSDAGGDLFIMDFLGMLGIPIVPTAQFPVEAPVLFLPAQAAGDPNLAGSVQERVAAGATVILSAALLATPQGSALAELAGIAGPVRSCPMQADALTVRGDMLPLERPLDLEADLTLKDATPVLLAAVEGRHVPFLTVRNVQEAQVFVLNVHTFTQADYDAVGEVLLAPRPLGLLDLPRTAANEVRTVFNAPLGVVFDAPARVTLQPLGDGSLVVQNYSADAQALRLTTGNTEATAFTDRFTGNALPMTDHQVQFTVGSRSRVWLAPAAQR